MKRERREVVKDMARRYAQGVIESLETIWQFPELTDEEFAVMDREIQLIAKRIGKTRTFISFVEADHE
ncbi:hypothetical protein JFV28_20190 [Pseudomonas sp. TH05]|uniref:hypothetical protein n=1 Tax=unclassified Pseudomonas TaxID=196821 RepID=UPI001914ACFD|nr:MULTISPECIES: hypothetical protein [unclassified Pseudomonas]MBK5541556.1 hypothetical protein [Pseudomonas sp. TH07]MBK5558165.1 hypothetical protein [Pseudomonas sp. TH05]